MIKKRKLELRYNTNIIALNLNAFIVASMFYLVILKLEKA